MAQKPATPPLLELFPVPHTPSAAVTRRTHSPAYAHTGSAASLASDFAARALQANHGGPVHLSPAALGVDLQHIYLRPAPWPAVLSQAVHGHPAMIGLAQDARTSAGGQERRVEHAAPSATLAGLHVPSETHAHAAEHRVHDDTGKPRTPRTAPPMEPSWETPATPLLPSINGSESSSRMPEPLPRPEAAWWERGKPHTHAHRTGPHHPADVAHGIIFGPRVATHEDLPRGDSPFWPSARDGVLVDAPVPARDDDAHHPHTPLPILRSGGARSEAWSHLSRPAPHATAPSAPPAHAHTHTAAFTATPADSIPRSVTANRNDSALPQTPASAASSVAAAAQAPPDLAARVPPDFAASLAAVSARRAALESELARRVAEYDSLQGLQGARGNHGPAILQNEPAAVPRTGVETDATDRQAAAPPDPAATAAIARLFETVPMPSNMPPLATPLRAVYIAHGVLNLPVAALAAWRDAWMACADVLRDDAAHVAHALSLAKEEEAATPALTTPQLMDQYAAAVEGRAAARTQSQLWDIPSSPHTPEPAAASTSAVPVPPALNAPAVLRCLDACGLSRSQQPLVVLWQRVTEVVPWSTNLRQCAVAQVVNELTRTYTPHEHLMADVSRQRAQLLGLLRSQAAAAHTLLEQRKREGADLLQQKNTVLGSLDALRTLVRAAMAAPSHVDAEGRSNVHVAAATKKLLGKYARLIAREELRQQWEDKLAAVRSEHSARVAAERARLRTELDAALERYDARCKAEAQQQADRHMTEASAAQQRVTACRDNLAGTAQLQHLRMCVREELFRTMYRSAWPSPRGSVGDAHGRFRTPSSLSSSLFATMQRAYCLFLSACLKHARFSPQLFVMLSRARADMLSHQWRDGTSVFVRCRSTFSAHMQRVQDAVRTQAGHGDVPRREHAARRIRDRIRAQLSLSSGEVGAHRTRQSAYDPSGAVTSDEVGARMETHLRYLAHELKAMIAAHALQPLRGDDNEPNRVHHTPPAPSWRSSPPASRASTASTPVRDALAAQIAHAHDPASAMMPAAAAPSDQYTPSDAYAPSDQYAAHARAVSPQLQAVSPLAGPAAPAASASPLQAAASPPFVERLLEEEHARHRATWQAVLDDAPSPTTSQLGSASPPSVPVSAPQPADTRFIVSLLRTLATVEPVAYGLTSPAHATAELVAMGAAVPASPPMVSHEPQDMPQPATPQQHDATHDMPPRDSASTSVPPQDARVHDTPAQFHGGLPLSAAREHPDSTAPWHMTAASDASSMGAILQLPAHTLLPPPPPGLFRRPASNPPHSRSLRQPSGASSAPANATHDMPAAGDDSGGSSGRLDGPRVHFADSVRVNMISPVSIDDEPAREDSEPPDARDDALALSAQSGPTESLPVEAAATPPSAAIINGGHVASTDAGTTRRSTPLSALPRVVKAPVHARAPGLGHIAHLIRADSFAVAHAPRAHADHTAAAVMNGIPQFASQSSPTGNASEGTSATQDAVTPQLSYSHELPRGTDRHRIPTAESPSPEAANTIDEFDVDTRARFAAVWTEVLGDAPAAAPGSSAAAPGSSAAAPGSSTAAPGSSTAAPGSSTASQGPSTAASHSEPSDVSPPSATVHAGDDRAVQMQEILALLAEAARLTAPSPVRRGTDPPASGAPSLAAEAPAAADITGVVASADESEDVVESKWAASLAIAAGLRRMSAVEEEPDGPD